MLMNKKVCLITPGHIATDPRLVKEAIALSKNGYDVHIIFSQYMQYLLVEDFKILNKQSWTYDCINWSNQNLLSKTIRLFSGVIQKLAIKFPSFSLSYEIILNRHFYWQYKRATKCKADIYIAHNLGALSVAYKVAKKYNKVVGFDAEDFHRNETTDDFNNRDFIIKSTIEDKYLPYVNYISAASPLIAKEYERLYKIKVTSILNVFPNTFLKNEVKGNKTKTLNLFWFSQTIGRGRGLEMVISSLGIVKDLDISIHLLGELSEGERKYLNELFFESGFPIAKVCYYPSIPSDEVIPFASNFDIGLATEISVPYNRNICLTNKLFTYIQAGNAVVYSDTLAQKGFMNQYHEIGLMYSNDKIHSLSNLISFYYFNREILEIHKKNAQQLGQKKLNWEIEQLNFMDLIKSIHF